MTQDELKRAAGHRAVELVKSGMVVGLGSGSTARQATLRLAEKLVAGALRDIVGIPTSNETARLASVSGIPLSSLEEHPVIDVTIDGADEVDPSLDVIKGLGGFFLREKIVAYATKELVIVVDVSKLSPQLGLKSSLPVEVARFGWKSTEGALKRLAHRTALRTRGGVPYVTDEGHLIIDCWFDGIEAPGVLSGTLNNIPGVVDNGLFVGMATTVVVADEMGTRLLRRASGVRAATIG